MTDFTKYKEEYVKLAALVLSETDTERHPDSLDPDYDFFSNNAKNRLILRFVIFDLGIDPHDLILGVMCATDNAREYDYTAEDFEKDYYDSGMEAVVESVRAEGPFPYNPFIEDEKGE